MSNSQDKNDDPISEQDKLTEHRLRMRFQFNDLIEEMIQEGQEQGAFDNLRGKGKPLDLDRSPFAGEWELAHKLMKENDVLPPWVVKRNVIVNQIAEIRVEYGRNWARHKQAFHLAQGKGHRDALSLSWEDICRRWEADLKRINKQIADFNLGRPTDRLEIMKLRLDNELQRAGAARQLRR